MDGLAPELGSTGSWRLMGSQRTLKSAIGCIGVGLHTGRKVRLTLHPAPAGTGIVFRRIDLPGAPDIRATWQNVIETRLCTVVGDTARPELRVGTVEHVLAALAGSFVGNAIVAVDGPEVPILDGSAASFVFLVQCAGTLIQDAAAAAIEILRPVRVAHGAASAELLPWRAGRADSLDMTMSIAFAAPAIGRQSLHLSLGGDAFARELARARTFTLFEDIERLRATGLARGGSLDNALVVDGARVLNPGGLRMPDEFVRHKMLDAVGDLALAGAPLRGRFVGHCSGHALNAELLRALFADPSNWREVPLVDRLVTEPLAAPYAAQAVQYVRPSVARADAQLRAA